MGSRMSDSEIEVVVALDPNLVNEFERSLGSAGAEVEGSPTRGYDGSQTASWLLVATTAITTAPAVIAELRGLLGRKKVGSVTIGDLTIDNPTPEDVDRAWAVLEARPQA